MTLFLNLRISAFTPLCLSPHLGSMKKLRGGHIVVAVVGSHQKSRRPPIVTFKKLTRAGRKPTYKLQKSSASDRDTTPSTAAAPNLHPSDMLLDKNLMGIYLNDPQDSGEAGWEDDDVSLPRRAMARKSTFLASIGAQCWCRLPMITWYSGKIPTKMLTCQYILNMLVLATRNVLHAMARNQQPSGALTVSAVYPCVLNVFLKDINIHPVTVWRNGTETVLPGQL